jgi:hypothetical protein
MCGVKEAAQAHRNCAFVFEIRKFKKTQHTALTRKYQKYWGF